MKEKVENQRGIEDYLRLPYSVLLHEVEDDGEKYWIAEAPELPGCTSHGLTVEEAVKSLEEAKKDWILDSLEKGEEVPIPVERDKFSGKTLLRMSCSLHRALSLMAESEKLSLNQLIVTILAKEVGKFDVLNRVDQKIDNLLKRINDVLGEQRALSLKSPLILTQYYQAGQHFVVDTPSETEAQVAVTAPAFLRGAVSTASPFEELWSCLPLQSPRLEQIVFGTAQEKAKEAVETEHK